jgi:transcriptional regulator with XRE-family HTH domain
LSALVWSVEHSFAARAVISMVAPQRLQRPRSPSEKAAVPKKAPNPVDKHVGSRVRMRRKMLAMSQGKLGKALGLTFQQVQKYEKGANRIGGSRLQQISQILQVPVAFFFEDAPGASAISKSDESALSLAHVDDFVSSSDGLRLIAAFTRIKSTTLRRRITSLVQEMAGQDRS